MKYTSKLPESFVESYKDVPVPWGPLGYITYKRTYSRQPTGPWALMSDNETEEWFQTVARCCQGLLDINGAFTFDEIKTLYHYVYNLKHCFSGRGLWQLGTNTVERIGGDSLQNCWHVACNNIEAFCFTFNQLMLGGGVGFNITPEQVFELPVVKYGVSIQRKDSPDVDLIVTDNREGWVDLLRQVLNCFFFTGKNLTYSTMCIRDRGAKISTFGGIASGAETLVEGVTKISQIIANQVGNKLRPIDCLDIFNIIGSVVVAGNVRRSAELAAGSCNDIVYLNAKNWKDYSLPNWRNMSNNSVICNDISELPECFWDGYTGDGEPYGLINLQLCRTHGRLIDGPGYRTDSYVTGTNPCGEITLESYEACNLSEIFLPNIESMDEFYTSANLMYKACKTISALKFSDKIVNEVVERNMRLGIGLGGVLQSRWVQTPEKFDSVYQSIEELDSSYSKLLGVNRSIKLTTVKPSGTISLLAGVTPGIHPAYSRYYIRRIRFSGNDPLVELCKKGGYPVEPLLQLDGSRDLNTMVVSFPIKTPKNTIIAADLTAIDQLNFQTLMQEYWSDNSVSMTCYYTINELNDIKQYLKQYYSDSIKSVSFLLHSEHGFKQAPYEKITAEEYQELDPIIKSKESEQFELIDSLECVSGSCPVK